MAQVEVERDGAVMVVTLNRPHRKNAMTLTMFALLADAWEEVTADDDLDAPAVIDVDEHCPPRHRSAARTPGRSSRPQRARPMLPTRIATWRCSGRRRAALPTTPATCLPG